MKDKSETPTLFRELSLNQSNVVAILATAVVYYYLGIQVRELTGE